MVKCCVVRKLLFSCRILGFSCRIQTRILVMEFCHLKTHLTSTRPMLAGGIEYAEQKLVITCLLSLWALQYCCDSGSRNAVSSRFLTQPCPVPLCEDLELQPKSTVPGISKETRSLVSRKLSRVTISYCKIHLFFITPCL